MYTKSLFFSFSFFLFSSFLVAGSEKEDAQELILEIKKIINDTQSKLERLLQEKQRELQDRFEHLSESRKANLIMEIFNDSNDKGVTLVFKALLESNKVKICLGGLNDKSKNHLIETLNNASRKPLVLQSPLSLPLSNYIELILQNSREDAKITLENCFNSLKNLGLDPEILS